MPKASAKTEPKLVKSIHPSRPDWSYYMIEPESRLVRQLAKAPVLSKTCSKPCTKVITLLPKTNIAGHTGVGYYVINIDGFRSINAYVISDSLNSTSQRGFSLALSFALNPFVPNVGVVGESSWFFNFDNYYGLEHAEPQNDSVRNK